MSVRVNERNHGDLTVIIKAKELASYTLKVTANEKYFPKRYRLTLTDKITGKAFDIFTLLYEANEIYPTSKMEYQQRQLNQRKAMAYCRSMEALIDIAKEAFNIPVRKCEYWTKLIFNVRNLIASWYKKDRERFGEN